MIIPGLVSATFRAKTVEEIISLAVAADLKAVEWSENAHVFAENSTHSLFVRDKCAAAGLEVAAYGSYYRLGENHSFAPVLESAKALGAPLIRIWAGTRPSREVSEEQFALMAKEAAGLALSAQKEQIALAFEWHKNTLTDTVTSAWQLLDLACSANLLCLWQPLDEQDEDERVSGIELLMGKKTGLFPNALANLHVFYRSENCRKPLEDGFEKWKHYLKILKKHTTPTERRYALLEFVMNDTESQFFEDAKQLVRLCNFFSEL